MPISNDWDINYNDKEIRHIDGILAYDGGAGTQPSVGEYMISASGAVGKIIACTGDVAKGTLTLTNVLGQFADNELFYIQSELPFDDVTPVNGGFKVGDTLVGAVSTSTLVVKAMEYNLTSTPGWGKAFGRPMSAVFSSGEQLNIQGGQADVADVVVGQTGTDNDVKWSGNVDGTLIVPGTKLPILTSTEYGTLQFVALTSKLIRTVGSWVADGYSVADTLVFVVGATTPANNGKKTVVSATATDMIVAEAVTDEIASVAEVVNGVTQNDNKSVIIHYDGPGTIAIPEDAKIADTTGATGAVGYAQRVHGSTATGSIRLVDSNTINGSWTNNNGLYLQDVLFYKALVAGKVFSVGDVVHGGTSGKEGCVLAVIDDLDNTGKLVLARKTGTFTLNEDIQVKVSGTWTKYGECESTTNYLQAAVVNTPGGVRSIQRASQGGLFPSVSLNIVRSSNAVYTYIKVGAVGAGYNQAGDSAVKVAAQDRGVSPIPADVPDASAIRVLSPNDTGNYIYMTYSAVDRTNNYFTLTGTIGSFLIAAGEASVDLTLNDNVHVCLIEKESAGVTVTNQIQYIGTIYVYWVTRKKGYLPADGTTSFTATGASIASNMQADDIVNLP